MLRLLTLGTCQLKLSRKSVPKYISGDCSFQIFQENNNLLRVRMQSRYVSSKSYLVWIMYDSDHIQAWYCKCKAGARTVGTCSHVPAVLWYPGLSLNSNTCKYGVKDWDQYLDDVAETPSQ